MNRFICSLIVVAFSADPSSSQPPIWVALHYYRTADELRLLAYSEGLVFSPNGRFLPLADRLGEAYRCFDAVWMRTAS